MDKKIRQKYDLYVTRQKVYDVMANLDMQGLVARVPAQKNHKRKGNFVSVGPNSTGAKLQNTRPLVMSYHVATREFKIYDAAASTTRFEFQLKK
jgi:hypothetical protein